MMAVQGKGRVWPKIWIGRLQGRTLGLTGPGSLKPCGRPVRTSGLTLNLARTLAVKRVGGSLHRGWG